MDAPLLLELRSCILTEPGVHEYAEARVALVQAEISMDPWKWASWKGNCAQEDRAPVAVTSRAARAPLSTRARMASTPLSYSTAVTGRARFRASLTRALC
jgi:hypothetical protein